MATKAPKNPDAPKKPAHRPRLEIDMDLLQKLANIHCTDEEIALIVGVSQETFVRRKREPEFAFTLAQARAQGRASLRRMQWRLAESGNATAQVWLGKQILGQRDKFEDLGEDKSPLPWSD
jgi:hypothetical protein